jgi:hypothetical protein
MKPFNPRLRVSLPKLDAYDALLVADVLERITSALWHAHGDHMADILARRGVDTPMPEDAAYASTPALDLDDIF